MNRTPSQCAELALDKGRFLALRAVNTSNLGASAILFVPLAKGIAVSSSVYDIRCSSVRGRVVVTNTAPTSASRSAGRSEVVFGSASVRSMRLGSWVIAKAPDVDPRPDPWRHRAGDRPGVVGSVRL